MRNFCEIPAAILAGGLGTRLRPVISHQPKVLADVSGRPFLTYLLDQLGRAGVRKVVLCTGYLGEQIQVRLGSRYEQMELLYSQEPSPQGTAGALRLALPLLRSKTVLAMNGDSYCATNLHEFLAFHRLRRAQATLLLTQVQDGGRFGRVEVDRGGRIQRFMEKEKMGRSGWVNAGMYLLSAPLLDSIGAGASSSLERDVFPQWIGGEIYGYRSSGRFVDIGTPQSYAEAQTFFTQENSA